jgi:hypothetical protein
MYGLTAFLIGGYSGWMQIDYFEQFAAKINSVTLRPSLSIGKTCMIAKAVGQFQGRELAKTAQFSGPQITRPVHDGRRNYEERRQPIGHCYTEWYCHTGL